ncbi:hypothetical protein WOLCODRAFT_142777 [Wolfiporia cocos MD-104 SS10]|uniref:Uncharacterized protein n=1 Tax=Wolfiporia cocos (strain MD-104) TaxID=742152 RepID=A0A2H3JSY8_WOLCO|nr:hypothetical protein WOLCODRAFT_142777 [Wolfiporia cocos MD-104 SS10]
MTFVNMVLVMRINALYGNRRTILIILVSFLTAEFSFEIFAAFYENHTTKFVAKPSFPPTLGCYSARKRVLLSVIAWSLNIMISSAFYVMTVIQVMRSFNIRDWATFKQRLTFRGTTNMLGIFFRDGSIFYAI